MELDPLFMEQRWRILQNLGITKLSPLQLAGVTDTTISNISQQLKLLEAANLVRKEKIQNREKGKPRALFSISDDYAYIVSVMDGFVEKKLLKISEGRKTLLKIWFLGEKNLREEVEVLYEVLSPYLSRIDAILLDEDKRELIIAASNLPRDIVTKISRTKNLKVKTSDIKSLLPSQNEKQMVVLYQKDVHDRQIKEV